MICLHKYGIAFSIRHLRRFLIHKLRLDGNVEKSVDDGQ